MKHFGIYANISDVQDALNAGTLENPYVATVQGNLDYNTIEQQTCAERGLCGDDPYNCHECSCEEQFPGDDPAICECEGKYWWDGECHDEPEPEPSDPCDECVSQDDSQECCECVGGTWTEVGPDAWVCYTDCESMGMCGDYPGCHECTCDDEYEEGTQEKCECQGKYWYDDECHDEPEQEPEPTCEEQGLCDDGEGGCVPCPDPCDEYEEGTQEKCECQGGTWDGENCNFDEGE